MTDLYGSSEPTALNVQNGVYTVTSPKGGHRTFKIRTAGARSKLAGKRIIELKQGDDWMGLAFWDDEFLMAQIWKRFRGSRGTRDAAGMLRAFHYPKGGTQYEKTLAIFLDLAVTHFAPERGSFWRQEGYALEVAANCLRCNRLLTHPDSLRSGIGPECATKV